MATKKQAPVRIDRLTPSRELLAEELAERGITQTALAKQMGRPLQAINSIVLGKKAITAETALQLEAALNIPAEWWMNLEKSYQLAKARAKLAP